MPGFSEMNLYARHRLKWPAVADGLKQVKRLDNVRRGVERFKGGLALFFAPLVYIFYVVFLNKGGVAQHNGAQISGGRGGPNGAAKALLHQRGNVAAVIDVGVGEDERINPGRIKRELAVSLKRFFATALIQPAIQQNIVAVHFEQVH